ncbi:hypothetical protein [Legionella fallonii]|uniref:Uncharacterized protein n=1 Tax=Legionella fallonii LLAP-10 TaxID=1212491 RepID=A0A098G8P3_9GAMM|nr:hypothetical protein [Legionella fallonii]CEG57840.1 conserved protein of unknown function [Legionella fallonii LLAP-10]
MHIVLLLGSSTAGKTSLCRELVAKHSWSSGSVDEICDKIQIERTEKLTPLLRKELKNKNLFGNLQSLMTEDDIIKLASRGILTISKGNHQFAYSFSNPLLEELELVLKKAGFNDIEIPDLANSFRLVTKIGDAAFKDHPFPDPMERLYDDVFNKNNSEKSFVLDVVPDPNGSAKECLEQFAKRAQLYRNQNPNEALRTSVVFAYCPPQKLSERIQERNRKAEIGNSEDKRVGLFPFYQLAVLTTADKKLDNNSENILSRNELFYMVNKHAHTDKIDDPIFLENPVDQEALQQNHDDNVEVTMIKNGKVMIQTNNDKVDIPTFDKPRIGSKNTIEEYSKLANRFGFFEKQERVSLNIPSGISFDAVINTAKGNPTFLANEFIEKLEKSKVYSERISIL